MAKRPAAILAFFLESTFVGLFFFGWERLSKVVHLAVTGLVALGSSFSALWILIANAWMQNPTGAQFTYQTMRMELASFSEVLFNPVAQAKFVHTVAAGYVVGSVFVLAISAWYLLRGRNVEVAKRSMRVAASFGLACALSVVALGDESGYVASRSRAGTNPQRYPGARRAADTTYQLMDGHQVVSAVPQTTLADSALERVYVGQGWRETERTVFAEAGSREGAIRRIEPVVAALEFGTADAAAERVYNCTSAAELIDEGISEDHALRLFETGCSGDQVICWVESPLVLTANPGALLSGLGAHRGCVINHELDPTAVKLLIPVQNALEEIRVRLSQGGSVLRVLAQFVRDHVDKEMIAGDVSDHEVSASIDLARMHLESATEELDQIILDMLKLATRQ